VPHYLQAQLLKQFVIQLLLQLAQITLQRQSAIPELATNITILLANLMQQ
jgi:hypothetical protein